MVRIAVSALERALEASVAPLAADLLVRLRQDPGAPPQAKTTRPFSRRAALELYQRKAAKGDRPWVRTEGYPALLAALGASPVGHVVVHGVTFVDAVYLVFTDPTRQRCVGVLRKQRLPQGP
jgi:hypothetical protein